MTYTIELTNNQKKQLETLIERAHRYIGFNVKLEQEIPLPMKESPAYKRGYEDGKKQAIKELPEVANKENEMYDKGYTQGIADYRKFIRVFESGADIFEDIRNTDGTLNIDMILQYLPMAEIMARVQAYEEKKQAEKIKVGDEVKDLATDNIGVVMSIGRLIVYITNNGVYSNTLGSLEKTGRHFDEVKQLLGKLKSEE